MPGEEYIQKNYWSELVQLKVQIEYLNLYQIQSDNLEKSIKIFLAITSSSSICGWAVWNQAQMIWATIIASSQLLSVVKDYLPYQFRRRALGKLAGELETIFLFAERKWYAVSEGELTSSEIHNLTIDIKAKKLKSLKDVLQDKPLPKKERLLEKAAEETKTYFHILYNI